MVGLGRVELPTNGLGIGQLFLNLYVFSVFSSVNFCCPGLSREQNMQQIVQHPPEADLHSFNQIDREYPSSEGRSRFVAFLRQLVIVPVIDIYPEKYDAKRGDHSLQAEFSGLISFGNTRFASGQYLFTEEQLSAESISLSPPLTQKR